MTELASKTTIEAAAAHLRATDSVLAEVIDSSPLPTIAPHKNYYQALVESVVSQQLSVKAAATILNRFKDLYSNEFPSPEEILATPDDQLRSVGLSRQKISYIKDLASKVLDETVQFNQLDELSNEAIITELTNVKGIGVWTVHMFLMFCMGRLDVLPVGDLGIKNGIYALYNLDEKPSPDMIASVAHDNGWHPYESVASWYIWQSLNNKPAL
jgi:DNA-3-methyladenine glycosylase II